MNSIIVFRVTPDCPSMEIWLESLLNTIAALLHLYKKEIPTQMFLTQAAKPGKQLPEAFCKKTEPEACNFIKKRLCHRCLPVNFAKFLGTPFLQNISGRLLLKG